MEAYPYAFLFFVPFIIIATYTSVNIFIAVVVNTMQNLQAHYDKEQREIEQRDRLWDTQFREMNVVTSELYPTDSKQYRPRSDKGKEKDEEDEDEDEDEEYMDILDDRDVSFSMNDMDELRNRKILNKRRIVWEIGQLKRKMNQIEIMLKHVVYRQENVIGLADAKQDV